MYLVILSISYRSSISEISPLPLSGKSVSGLLHGLLNFVPLLHFSFFFDGAISVCVWVTNFFQGRKVIA